MLNTLSHSKYKTIVFISGLSTILYAILSVGILFGESNFYSPFEHIMFILYGISSYFSCLWVTNKLIYAEKRLNSSDIIQIIFISGLINAVLTTAIFLLSRWGIYLYLALPGWIPPMTGIAINIGYTFFLIHLIITGLFLSYFSLQISHQSSLKQMIAEKESATAQFKLLQQQISPHFLFNNLNVLASLIPLDAKLAEEFVTKLSNLYRFILKHKDEELISLSEELTFVRQYSEVMNIRFNNAYQLVIDQQTTDETAFIAPGALQTCIENAIKHNIASAHSPLAITVKITDQTISIENPLRLKNSMQPSTKTGLVNLTKRYQSLSETPVIIEKSHDSFKVSMPLLTLNKNVSS